MTTVVSYDTWRCRDDGSVVRHLQVSCDAVSCDGPEVSYDGGVVRRTTHSCDVVLEKYVTRMNSQFLCVGTLGAVYRIDVIGLVKIIHHHLPVDR